MLVEPFRSRSSAPTRPFWSDWARWSSQTRSLPNGFAVYDHERREGAESGTCDSETNRSTFLAAEAHASDCHGPRPLSRPSPCAYPCLRPCIGHRPISRATRTPFSSATACRVTAFPSCHCPTYRVRRSHSAIASLARSSHALQRNSAPAFSCHWLSDIGGASPNSDLKSKV